MGCQSKKHSDIELNLPSSAHEFFENIQRFCGDEYLGVTKYPDQIGHQLTGTQTKLEFYECFNDSISIKFFLNDSHIMNWTLHKIDEIDLKLHFHHKELAGLPEGIVSYEGISTLENSKLKHSFSPTEASAESFPEIAKNKWVLEVDTTQHALIYTLFRDTESRFKAIYQKHN